MALVEGGYASSHFTAEKSNYGRLIAVSEENAKRSKEKRWVNMTIFLNQIFFRNGILLPKLL